MRLISRCWSREEPARASSLAALIPTADVVITMLPNTPDVAGVVSGPGGLLETGRAGMMMIDMSTIDPAASRSFGAVLADKGIRFVDAAVGRSPAHAERGESLFMVGAAAGDLERARPILEAMGNKIIHCGPQGSGISMKIVNNFLAMATCQLSAEALTLGSKLGLSAATMYEVITNSLASNDHLKTYWPTKVLKGDVEPGFAVDLAYKDLSIGVSAAAQAGVPVPTGAAARDCSGGGAHRPRARWQGHHRRPARGSGECRHRAAAALDRGRSRRRHPLTAPAASPSTT